jgi:hypothetical protein
MDCVAAQYPEQALYVVEDNPSTHSGKVIGPWLWKHEKMRCHYTPAASSWLNQDGDLVSLSWIVHAG